MMNNLAAQVTATFHVFGLKLQERSERGQTTAEYIGILAFAALLAIVLIGFKDTIGSSAKGIITTVFDKIKEKVG